MYSKLTDKEAIEVVRYIRHKIKNNKPLTDLPFTELQRYVDALERVIIIADIAVDKEKNAK